MHEEKSLEFGEWIYANGRGRGSGPSCGGMRGGFGGGCNYPVEAGGAGGRGGFGDNRGRGRGGYFDWREHPERKGDVTDKDLVDTATSPAKKGDVVMTEAEKIAKRRLGFEEPIDTNTALVPAAASPMELVGVTGKEGEGDDLNGKSDNKRYKMVDGKSISANSGSAASLEDDRRVQ